MTRTVRLFSKPDCHLCQDARMILDWVAARQPLEVQEIDVEQHPVWHQLFGERVPVVDLGDNRRLYWPFGPDEVLAALNGAAAARPLGEPAPLHLGERSRRLVLGIDALVYHFSRHWLAAMALSLGVYAGLPVLAPVLMAAGYTVPANLIYTAYRLACHQLPSRSFFVAGQQMAFCERDAAIYASLLAATLVFGLVRGRLKPLPWKAYLAFVAPIALDGGTQLVGLRTSTWELRVITGALFGIGSAWLAFPYLEEAFGDFARSAGRQLLTASRN